MPIFIRETFVDKTRKCQFGDSDWYEYPYDEKKLFANLQKEYGRCTSKMYRERKQGPDKVVGWVFEKKMQYEDRRPYRKPEYYIREVWVEVRKAAATYITRVWEGEEPCLN